MHTHRTTIFLYNKYLFLRRSHVIANEPAERRCEAGQAAEQRAVRGVVNILKKPQTSLAEYNVHAWMSHSQNPYGITRSC